MADPDAVGDFIDKFFIAHADKVYDPVKAHEYYVKNRELKGRKKASFQVELTSTT